MGVVMARRSSWSACSARTSAPARAPVAHRAARRRQPARPAADRRRRPATSGWLLTSFVIQALATGCMLAGVDYLASDVLGKDGAATILFVCFVGPALLLTPVWAALGTRIGKKRGYLAALALPRRRRAARRAPRRSRRPRVVYLAVVPGRRRVRRRARCSRWRCCPTRRRSTPGAPARTGPASTPACGPPARPSGSRSGPGVFALVLAVGGYRSSTDGDVAQPDSALTAITLGFSVLPAVADPAQPAAGCAATRSTPPRWMERDRGDRMTDALARLREHAGRRPAGARRPHPRLRLRLRPARRRPDRPRGGGGVRRLERPGPDRVPEPAADGERPGRLRRRPARRPGRRGRHGHLRRHRVLPARRAGARATAGPTSSGPRMVVPVHRARGVPQGRALLRRRGGRGPGRRRLPRRPRRDGGRDRRDPDRPCSWSSPRRRTRTASSTRSPPIAAAAAERGIRCHVDACIGGWVLPYAARLGRDVPPWTFAVDGRHVDLGRPAQVRLRPQGHLGAAAPHARRCGGRSTSRTPTGRATRCSTRRCSRRSPAARSPAPGRWCSRWATTGYERLARDVFEAVDRIVAGRRRRSRAARGRRPPDSTLVALATDGSCDAFTVCDEMAARGWYVQPQMSYAGQPPTIHLSVSAATLAHVDEFLAALQPRRSPRPSPPARSRSTRRSRRSSRRSTRPRSPTPTSTACCAAAGLAAAATAGSRCPTGWPRSTRCSTSPSPRMREALLVAFLDRLQRPTRG